MGSRRPDTAAEIDPLHVLKQFVSAHPTQLEAAQELGISQAFLSDILHERRSVPVRILENLGLKQIVVKL